MNPNRPVNFDSLLQIIEQSDAASHAPDGVQCAHQDSDAFDYLLESSLIDLDSFHASVTARDDQINAACADSQKMIDRAPKEGAAYLPLVNTLSMACRRSDIIQTCDNALQVTDLSDGQRSWILAIKAAAVLRKQQICADPFTKLPVEVTDIIFSQLPEPTIIQCLSVSRLWRERTAGYPSLWRDLWVSDTRETAMITDAAAAVAQNVEHLTLSTSDHRVGLKYLDLMKNGQFTKIKSLRITEYATQLLRDTLIPLSLALQSTRHTLTHLTIEQNEIDDSASLPLILAHCSALTSLTYSTDNKIGDFTELDGPHPLVNLELITPSILTDELKRILKKCQQLRRLVVDHCYFPILDTVVNHAPRLEILGYNICRGYKVSSLNTKNVVAPVGLRIIHCHSPVDGISTFARFIHTYSNTLEIIDINTTILTYASSNPIPTPDGFQLKRLRSLNIGLTFPIQQMMLDGIRDSTSLKHLYAYSLNDIPGFISILLELPPLKTLLISWFHLYRRNTPVPNMIVQLFDRYARLSESESTLQSVVLDRTNLVSDDALCSLGDVRTLQAATLISLKLVTSHGIETFLKKCGNQLTKLKISAIAASDENITAIAKCKRVTCLEFCSLQNLTDHSIRQFVDELSNNQLRKLTVTACPNVTEEGVRYAENKVEVVSYNSHDLFHSL